MQYNTIYVGDARHMVHVPDNTVQLIITSPPYNVGKPYTHSSDTLPWDEYVQFLSDVWDECFRVLCPGGRICINIANTGRKPYVPLHAYVIMQLVEKKFLLRGEIIWDKRTSAGISTAWGSFGKASNPVLRDTHEYIVIASKHSYTLAPPHTHSTTSMITPEQFTEYTKSVWTFPAASHPSHPAVFPEELPKRLILLYSNLNDIVLDPFLGIGTTAIAAYKLGRRYIGYDISPEYIRIAHQNLETLTHGS